MKGLIIHCEGASNALWCERPQEVVLFTPFSRLRDRDLVQMILQAMRCRVRVFHKGLASRTLQ